MGTASAKHVSSMCTVSVLPLSQVNHTPCGVHHDCLLLLPYYYYCPTSPVLPITTATTTPVTITTYGHGCGEGGAITNQIREHD